MQRSRIPELGLSIVLAAVLLGASHAGAVDVFPHRPAAPALFRVAEPATASVRPAHGTTAKPATTPVHTNPARIPPVSPAASLGPPPEPRTPLSLQTDLLPLGGAPTRDAAPPIARPAPAATKPPAP